MDLEKGFWWSNSNQEIQGITGVERSLSAMIDDPQSEVNQLNENGITTIFNSYGSGLRLWGNRTAARRRLLICVTLRTCAVPAM